LIIELRDVWFTYPGSREPALRGVSIAIRSGEAVLVQGPNGSGKTTLLKIIALLYRPSRGSVLVDGEEYWGRDPSTRLRIRRRVVYVHEKPILLRRSVLENVLLGLRIRGVEDAEERALRVLRELGIEELAKRSWRELSAGQAQLVSIARALAVEPEILLLDEPLAHLDRDRRAVLVEVLRRLKRSGVGIVIASHWPRSEVVDLGLDKVFEMSGGALMPG